jgi:hypothetical protein
MSDVWGGVQVGVVAAEAAEAVAALGGDIRRGGGDDGCPKRPVYGQRSPRALARMGEGGGQSGTVASHGLCAHELPSIASGVRVW